RVIHETTPIVPADGQQGQSGLRDTLVLTYRAAGFQAP
ncbi:MAG: 2OG-Fe dioxygenase family protein, partial [Polaromonas sp.]|nr:2OG-Fe dioxygenase family protein [Polaromonas sp.]